VRSSLWFLPGIILVVAVALALGLIELDRGLQARLVADYPQLLGSGAAGARGLLTTVASSMITVAGVVFSITLVALGQASSQYSSRVLRNFMRDRVNQSVLGVFVGIFAYCLVVLRTIRAGDEGAFVPPLAVFGGLILAFIGILVLIYFIHHISTSIQASEILATAAQETLAAVEACFPDPLGTGAARVDHAAVDAALGWFPILATRSGYIQTLDTGPLLRFAAARGVVIRIDRAIGEFMVAGTPIASMQGGVPADEDGARLSGFFVVARQRTVEQDVEFGLCQMTDVALKALSPGINDTTTAVMCVHHLTTILVRLSDRVIPDALRDDEGTVRVLLTGPTYARFLDVGYDRIRRNATGHVEVLDALLDSLAQVAGATTAPPRRAALRTHAREFEALTTHAIDTARDRGLLEARVHHLHAILGGMERSAAEVMVDAAN
jgi:uncharacterized membrane protein